MFMEILNEVKDRWLVCISIYMYICMYAFMIGVLNLN